MPDEIPLAGGNTGARVVRVGATVRKAWHEHSSGVLAYMRALRTRGVDVPEPLGRDERGRMMIEFVDGTPAIASPALTSAQLGRIGGMVRAIHEASRGLDAGSLGLGPALIPASAADLVCHGDLTPWNLLLGERWVFIDWDGAAASTRLWDLAYSAQAFTLNDSRADPWLASGDLRAFVDGYGADARLRALLADALPRRARAMHDLLERSHREGREPWGSMHIQGHGAHWHDIAGHLDRHRQVWLEALTTP